MPHGHEGVAQCEGSGGAVGCESLEVYPVVTTQQLKTSLPLLQMEVE